MCIRDSNRPLHEAVCHGLNVVQLLVHYGAKLNIQNVDGKTPLHLAAEHEQSDVFVFLLKSEDAYVELADVWRNTPLHYLTSGQMMTELHEEFVAEETKKYQHLLIHNAAGVTPLLHVAAYCMNQRRETFNVRSLVSQTDLSSEQLTRAFSTYMALKTKVYCREETSVTGPQFVDCNGNTPLHRAVGVYGCLKMYRVNSDVRKIVEFLVKRGADINAQNNDGLTPLHVARGKEAIEACLALAGDQSFTVVDKRGRNFWHLIFFSRNRNDVELEVIKRLITSASDAMHNSDDLNRTPLHYACMNRNSKCAALKRLTIELIRHFCDEHINKQDTFDRTALHYAAMAEDSELLDFLKTKQAADIPIIQDSFGYSEEDYLYIRSIYNSNISCLQLVDTSSFIARNFSLITDCIPHCFSDRRHNLESSKAELHTILCNLRVDNTNSCTLNTYFNYSDYCRKTAALKRRIDEQDLLADNKESAMQPPDMFAAIQCQVKKAMRYLAKEISVRDVRFACKVVPVGSAHEGTKIGCCDEFDYNFVLTDLSKSCTVCYSPESPPGFVLVRASTPDYDEDLFNSNGILNTRIVKFQFETIVKQILSSFSFYDATGFDFIDPVDEFIVQPGNTSMKLHTHINLEFTKPVNGCHVLHHISVDVVPALHIDDWWPDDMRREDFCQPGDCLIVFTQPQVKYPWIGWTEPHGFISFARAESRLLRDCPRVIKAAFMVVKRMSKYFCQYEFFSSHVIKTALLWCLDEVSSTSKCSSSSYSDEVSKDELWCWVQNIL